MSNLTDNEIVLHLREDVKPDPSKGWLRALHYDICKLSDATVVGSIDFRVGYTTNLVLYGGHLGYHIHEAYRGNRYAARSCLLLLQLAKKHGMDVIWITCNPDNLASRKTCEIIGAELVEIVDLPPENDQYQKGERQKCRYRLIVY